ncbi:S8 family serine peptidase, partial [Enterobacter mori]
MIHPAANGFFITIIRIPDRTLSHSCFMYSARRKYMRKSMIISTCFLAATFCLPPGPLQAAADFRTPEYYASTGLDYLRAAEAYERGYTGKGVIVGVLDAGFATSGEFAGKYPYGIKGSQEMVSDHGINVTGVISALKNDIGMHGIAFDSQLMPYNSADLDGNYGTDIERAWRMFASCPDITIINNSWASLFHLDDEPEPRDPDYWNWVYDFYKDFPASLLAARDKLVVMGAGNSGHLAPSTMAGLPTLVERIGADNDISLNWLNVSAFDPAYPSSHPAFIPVFTNLGQYASEYTLLAPGVNINTTASADTYVAVSGTSFATPYVSGVAALVQEAFPWMGGRQLADTLLSTATPVTGEHQPRYIVLYRIPDDDDYMEEIIAYTASHAPLNPTPEEIDAITEGITKPDTPDFVFFRAKVVAALDTPEFLSQAEYDGLFGQGIVNAGKAVQGPGYFNADRLIPSEALSRGEFGGDYALYRIDTRGHSALWSNDIGQRTAKDGELAGLDVGLHKTGEGLLRLTGNNTWLGPTVAAGGGIALGKTGQGDRPAVAGDVYVLDGAWFTGNGSVGGDLHSAGLLIPGLKENSGSRLAVQGRIDSRGTTFFYLDPDGRSTGLDATAISLGTLDLGTPDG